MVNNVETQKSDAGRLMVVDLGWPDFLGDDRVRDALEQQILPEYLQECRWFAGKARKLTQVTLRPVALQGKKGEFMFCLLDTYYHTGKSETYQLTLATAARLPDTRKGCCVARLGGRFEGYLVDSLYTSGYREWLLESMVQGAEVRGEENHRWESAEAGEWVPMPDESLRNQPRPLPEGRLPGYEQSNTSLLYGDRWFFKLYRKLFLLANPEPAMVRYLSCHGFVRVPAYRGEMEWRPATGARMTLGVWQQQIEGQGDAWPYVLSLLKSRRGDAPEQADLQMSQLVDLLATRTAEMHNCLVRAEEGETDFQAIEFDAAYRDGLQQHFDRLLARRLDLLKDAWDRLGAQAQALARPFADQAAHIRSEFAGLSTEPLQSLRIRIHGDYHLGQVVRQDNDLWILDFEGEPESSVADRMIRHSPLKDVAGMLRSFHYAAYVAYYFDTEGATGGESDTRPIGQWYDRVRRQFLSTYTARLDTEAFRLTDPVEFRFLLDRHLLEKAVYELGYELNSRPDWAVIPLEGIHQILYPQS